jgi:hypothetical protein
MWLVFVARTTAIDLTSERFLSASLRKTHQNVNPIKKIASSNQPLIQLHLHAVAGSDHDGRAQSMQRVDDTGCLTQRSQLERLRELADGVVQDRVKELSSSVGKLPTVLIVIGGGAKESTWDVESLVSDGARLGRGTQWLVAPEVALANFVPTQAILRILRETGATGAAIVAPVTSAAIAMQLADFDHEQSLTARLVQQPDSSPTVGKWDFGSVLWAVRLRQMLLASHRPPAAPPSRPVTAPASVPPAGVSKRRGQMREMREQLHRDPAAAPSWLQ